MKMRATRWRSAFSSLPCWSGCATTRTAASLSTRCCTAPSARASPTAPKTARCAHHSALIVNLEVLLPKRQTRTSAQHESMHALDAKAHAHFSLLPQISPTFLWRLRCACTCLQKNIHRDCPFLAAPSPFFIQKPTHLSLLHCFYPLPTTGCQTKPWKARHKRHVPCLHCYYSLA